MTSTSRRRLCESNRSGATPMVRKRRSHVEHARPGRFVQLGGGGHRPVRRDEPHRRAIPVRDVRVGEPLHGRDDERPAVPRDERTAPPSRTRSVPVPFTCTPT